ncbi:homogentisate 1,2-dioxygenase [Sphingomonas naphthae]|uniref:Homogentisate 1,2-dioxygenase n=1 Tax=Sphingomonas naphthae TaxID=1813468 RepID=A0ABY7TMR7_9SPHN|nr:homogentisate 1,2-dioxygenase [Sphingomonas naphthae]WCT73977.1 homogentisate 1,2-dioxygenase [Sphingomonas naphthae]
MRIFTCLMLAGLAAAPIAATAQGMADHPAPQCAATPAPLPPELSGWATRSAITAATTPAGLKAATLTLGKGADATLGQTSGVTYVVRPEKPGGSVSYGGLFAFTVAKAGTYRVALGSGAWIDVLKGKTASVSTAHGHGPDCTGVRKMVDFALTPGKYVLQVAANGSATLPLMVTAVK